MNTRVNTNMITTLLEMPGYRVVRNLGMVRGIVVRSRSIFGTLGASLQTIVGRVVDPLQPAVVSACFLSAGNPNALNVIPDFVELGGTARAYSPEVRDQLEAGIGRLARGAAAMFGIEAD